MLYLHFTSVLFRLVRHKRMMSMQLYCAGKRAGEGARLVLPPGGCGAKLCCEAPDNDESEGQ